MNWPRWSALGCKHRSTRQTLGVSRAYLSVKLVASSIIEGNVGYRLGVICCCCSFCPPTSISRYPLFTSTWRTLPWSATIWDLWRHGLSAIDEPVAIAEPTGSTNSLNRPCAFVIHRDGR